MNPARVQKFVEVYAKSLLAVIAEDPVGYDLGPGDTPAGKAYRVSLHTAGLIERHGAGMLIPEAPGIRRACGILKIPNTAEGLQAYFDGNRA